VAVVPSAGPVGKWISETIRNMYTSEYMMVQSAALYGWIPHNAGFGFLDLAPSILHSDWFWDYIS
jgi:hypothetical protein